MTEDEIRKQSWDFFQMQAGQRLTTFNFYIAISSLLSTGLAASFRADNDFLYLGVTFGLLLFLFSIVFWKLDQRNRDLIHGAEASLKFFESKAELQDEEEGVPHVAKRFTREEFDTKNKQSGQTLCIWHNHYSYSDCLRAVFIIFGTAGLVGAVCSIVNLMG